MGVFCSMVEVMKKLPLICTIHSITHEFTHGKHVILGKKKKQHKYRNFP